MSIVIEMKVARLRQHVLDMCRELEHSMRYEETQTPQMQPRKFVRVDRDLAKMILESLNDNLEAVGGCDHSVGICCCHDILVRDRLKAIVEAPAVKCLAPIDFFKQECICLHHPSTRKGQVCKVHKQGFCIGCGIWVDVDGGDDTCRACLTEA